MKLKDIQAVLLLIAFALLTSVPVLHAEENTAPFEGSCGAYKTPVSYVRNAAFYCLNEMRPNACHRRAEEFFRSCKYAGDYQTMSKKAKRELLLMLVFAKAPQFAKYLETKG